MKKLIALFFAAFLFSCIAAFAQTDLTEADKMLYEQAIKYSDTKQMDKAVEIYDALLKKYPDNWELLYEKAYSYSLLEDHQKSLDILKTIKKPQNTSHVVYSLMGSSYDNLGKWKESIEILDEGLKHFPESGKLHFDKAITYGGQNMEEQMLQEFLLSTVSQEQYASSYYYLASFMCPSEEAGMGILFGTYFRLLDPSSDRSYQISDLIYSSYNDHILLNEEGKVEVNLTGLPSLVESEGGSMEEPFAYRLQKYYQWDENARILRNNGYFSIADLTRLRKHFYELCFDGGKDGDMYDDLLTYEKTIMEAGHWEAYNMWLFAYGNPDEYNVWVEKNEDKFEAFVDWFNTHLFLHDKEETGE